MSETIKVAQYFYLDAPDRPGEAARMLRVLQEEGVNLLALSGFPSGRRAQVDLVPEDPARLPGGGAPAALEAHRSEEGPVLITGEDRIGALVGVAEKLAGAKINIVATQAVATGPGVFGAILWVAPADVRRATKVLGAV